MIVAEAESVVIIGSGPAGWSAAIYSSRANLRPLVFEGALTQENYQNGTMPLGQLNLTTEVENYAGFPAGAMRPFVLSALDEDMHSQLPPVPKDEHGQDENKYAVMGPELMLLMRQQAKNFGTRVITDDIVEVDFSTRPFRLKSLEGQEIRAHTVIVATGARANYLGLESEHRFKNRGVSACAVCDGALPRFRNKPLIVVGGGDSAVEEATYLTKFASKVHLVHRRDELRASKIMQERAFSNPKIEMVWSHGVEEVLGDDQRGLTGVRLHSTKDQSKKQMLEAAGLFLAIGHTPNTSFLKGQLEMNAQGYIKWKAPFRTYTSVEGVFAAGDVADDYYRQAITSAGTGCMAALDAERYLADKGMH
jgi:thioredoxin reductase (NADPH)